MPASSKGPTPPPPTPSEAAFLRLLNELRSGKLPESTPVQSRDAFIDELYRKADEYRKHDRYQTIADAWVFNTKVAGVSFEGRQDVLAGLRAGDPLELVRDRDNRYDSNAIAVKRGALQIGFLNKELAERLAPRFDQGVRYRAEVTAITGGGSRSRGVNIRVYREAEIGAGPVSRAVRSASDDEIRRALIGDRPIRDPQLEVLKRLERGERTLAVMGTGRGKSFCYQYPAATRALAADHKTLVVYPLRALANDQFDALSRRLGVFGLRIFRANGAIGEDERARLMAALEDGSWDIICSTPEFVQYHLERFGGEASRPDLLVVDEAHHLLEAKHRGAYGKLGSSLAALGEPQVLALTATARSEVFEHICNQLGIGSWVIDATVRKNLHVVDARGTKDREAYIERTLRDGGKAIIYCNSRSGASKVAETLRRSLGNEVAFYHAGIPSAVRSQVESYFREGALRAVVATSAFGEGIDLPDVRHVFLYHLNFSFTDFNQQAGRAGRDGENAWIHLLYDEGDRRINDYLIARTAPALETLREIYREMKRLAGADVLRMNDADIAQIIGNDLVGPETIGVALRIFEDAGLVRVTQDEEEGRRIVFNGVRGRIDLTQNERFAEGQAERESFDAFCELALKASAKTLETIINRPIYPERVPLLGPLPSERASDKRRNRAR